VDAHAVVAGFVQTIKGEGMPEHQRSTHGDLFIEYNVVLPSTLSQDMKRSAWRSFIDHRV
jgi:DnaJ-related protein SCJ1